MSADIESGLLTTIEKAKELFPIDSLVMIKSEGNLLDVCGKVLGYRDDLEEHIVTVKILDCYIRLAKATKRFSGLKWIVKDKERQANYSDEKFDGLIINFDIKKLRSIQSIPEFNLDGIEKADLLFGSMYHSFNLKGPFAPCLFDCDHRDCKKRATLDIWINIYGTVHNYFVCSDHAEYHGRCSDGMPLKQE